MPLTTRASDHRPVVLASLRAPHLDRGHEAGSNHNHAGAVDESIPIDNDLLSR